MCVIPTLIRFFTEIASRIEPIKTPVHISFGTKSLISIEQGGVQAQKCRCGNLFNGQQQYQIENTYSK